MEDFELNTGENGSEAAEPTGAEEIDFGFLQEGGGEPPAEGEAPPAKPAEPPPEKTGENEAGPAARPPEEMPLAERAVFAEMRRRAEAEARARAQEEVDRAYAAAFGNSVNPYTGRPITSKAEYDEYQRQYQEDQRAAQFQRAGIDPGIIQQMVAEHPAVRQAAAVAREMQTRQVQSFTEAQIGELGRAFPDCGVKTLADLRAADRGAEVLALWSKGIPLARAYAAVHVEDIAAQKAAAAKQSAINAANGKSHLRATGGESGGAVEVTAAELETYRNFLPDATAEEIRKFKAKHKFN